MKKPKIVIDTNVLVSALHSNLGMSYQLLMKLDSGLFDIAVSVPLVLEYEDVTKRAGRVAIKLSKQQVSDVIDYICHIADKIKVYYLWRPYLKDPKDDMVLELAISAQCTHIITFNKRDFVGAEKFGINISTPKEFLKKLEVK